MDYDSQANKECHLKRKKGVELEQATHVGHKALYLLSLNWESLFQYTHKKKVRRCLEMKQVIICEHLCCLTN